MWNARCLLFNVCIIIISTGLDLTDSKCFDQGALCSEFSLCLSFSDSFFTSLLFNHKIFEKTKDNFIYNIDRIVHAL